MAEVQQTGVSLPARSPIALRRVLGTLGPGIVSAASDNDPTTVATLSIIGATTLYGLEWLVVLVVPMLAIVQVIGAAVGAVCRTGLEDAVRQRYGLRWAYVPLIAVLLVNLLTLAADVEGGAAALGLLFPLDYRWFVVPFALVIAVLLVRGSYPIVERVLSFVALVFFGYVGSAIFARPDWFAVLRDTLEPHLSLSSDYVAGAVALLGTTLTSYAYVWETIGVKERRPPIRHLGIVQADAALGMVFAGFIFFFIVIATGATLGVHHGHADTAQEAAAALAPIAGKYAEVLFGVGLLASALLAVPVLAGTCAYVLAEAFGWRGSLDAEFGHAKKFYWSLLISLVAGTLLGLLGIPPMKLLFWSSIAGAFGTPITLAFMMLIARDRSMMKEHRIGPPLAGAGWIVTAIVISACSVFLYQTIAKPSP
jgi:Mn2+/Fe2+ NRAMP family transporter